MHPEPSLRVRVDGGITIRMQNIITTEDIKKDIQKFQNRITIAREKLAALPERSSSYKERKKLQTQKRNLRNEIEHCKCLIAIAQEGLKRSKYQHDQN